MHTTNRRRALVKYSSPSSRSTPEKIRNVTAVPTEGIVTKVGRNVPMMLPTVLKAPRLPTTLPPSSRELTVYFTREGVTVPSRNSGNTNTIMQERNAARIRKLLLMVSTRAPEISRITYFPTSGIAPIHTAEIRSLR